MHQISLKLNPRKIRKSKKIAKIPSKITPPPKPTIAEIKEVIKLTKINNIIIALDKLSGNTINNLKKKSYK